MTYKPTDFNDLQKTHGTKKVKEQLKGYSSPPPQPLTVELDSLDNIDMKAVNWLWDKRIPFGKISVIAGNPGLGKSQVTAFLAATVSAGLNWPDCKNSIGCKSVVILSSEDDPEDTIKPRMIAAGADPKKCHILKAVLTDDKHSKAKRGFNLCEDVERLETVLQHIGDVGLIVIDPVSAYMGRTDSHNNADVRATLSPLSDLAATYGAAIVLVTHLNKSKDQEPIARVIGSIGLVAAARAGYIVMKDENDSGLRYFLPIKNNLGNDTSGFSYRIDSIDLGNDILTSKVTFNSVPVEANTILFPEKKSQTNGAKAFLEELLSNGAMLAKEIFEQAESMDYSKPSIQRAAKALGLKRKKLGMDGGWEWSLPVEDTEDYEGDIFSVSVSLEESFEDSSTEKVTSSTPSEPSKKKRKKK